MLPFVDPTLGRTSRTSIPFVRSFFQFFDTGISMCRSARLYQCVRCHRQVIICSHCDRGNIYCAEGCAQTSRREKLKEAQLRYDKTQRAKKLKALRQQRYRQRNKEKATHQGLTTLPLYDLLLIALEKLKKAKIQDKKQPTPQCSTIYCHFCGVQCSHYLRMFFLE